MSSSTPASTDGLLDGTDLLDGMVLAATTADDQDGAEATPGLAPSLAAAFEARTVALSKLGTEPRHAEVRRMAARLGAVDPRADLPARARAILAGSLPRALGRKWASQAPPVRRGFRVDPGLKATLRRLAGATDQAAHARELDAAEGADPRLKVWAERLANGADPARVLGALALGAAGDLVGDARSRPWRRIGAELKLAWESPWRK